MSDARENALREYLENELGETIEYINNEYGYIYDTNLGEYKVCTDDEADEEVTFSITETASYFNADFLEQCTELPETVFTKLVDENEAVAKLIEATCGMDYFVEQAVLADGRGHFLSGYDSEEIELPNGYFAYRIN